MTASAATSTPSSRRTNFAKPTLWFLTGLAFLSVLVFTEHPFFAPNSPDRARVFGEKLIFLPNALAGLTAFLLGPLQFSTRLRQRNPSLHRLLGKVYVISILVAAPSALLISHHLEAVRSTLTYLYAQTWAQAGLWLLFTIAAFVTSRILNPLPAIQHMSDQAYVIFLFLTLIVAIVVPDLYFSGRELTTRRVR
ncbi:MAG TPA: DUF2306 domain-containing protein [Edaphobacter sp.]